MLADKLTFLMAKLEQKIVTTKLQGQVLRHITGTLGGSVHSTSTQAEGAILSAGVEAAGGPAWYGKLHEHGGTFTIPEHPAKEIARSSTGKFRKVGKAELSKYHSENSKYGLESVMHRMVPAHSITFPERSFMRSTLAEMRTDIIAELRETTVMGLRGSTPKGAA
jgi:hypothetical protein